MRTQLGVGITLIAVVALVGCQANESDSAPTTSATASIADAVHRAASTANATAGVVSIDLRSGAVDAVDADTRFPILSTFKTYAVGALLSQSVSNPGLLDETESVTAADIVANSPVLSERVGTRVSWREISAAALQRSDNAAGNLLLRRLGGPSAITAFARRIGDTQTRLDRWETDLNEATPGDARDTTTPRGLATGYRALLDGAVLPAAQRAQLVDWLRGSQTSQARFRAQLPSGWSTADKTGGGSFQTTNDAGLLFGPDGQRMLLVVMTRGTEREGPLLGDLVAEIAADVVRAHS